MKKPYLQARDRQVYRFKAALRHRPGLWRRIEIQGTQFLEDLDAILRKAFNHDIGDHMSGFWKLPQQGTGQRFREVALGDIEPFGGGSGANRHIARLELKPGDKLKYVYDFGDWVEHRITLEEIVEPESEGKYPRIVDQNQPRYRYCQECKDKGRKTRATWICIDCSNAEQEVVRVCEKCLEARHEDHHAEEIVY